MLYEDKAKELGAALQECDETTFLHAAELTLQSDSKAQEMIHDFQQRQQKIQELQEADTEIDQEMINEFNNLQDQMKENKSLQIYFAAQASFQELLHKVNMMINDVLKGGGSCSESGCSGDCSGCC